MSSGAFRIDVADEFSPRVSAQAPRRSFSLSLPSFKLIDGLPRRSFSYTRIPEEPIKLSVLKLDGSSFDINVMKTATVAELKMAVEAEFSHMPKKGPGKISWPHVWGRFCLCYEGWKLITETDYISKYGIQDGDQLYFLRHTSTCYTFMKKQSKKQTSTSKQPKRSLTESKSREEKEQTLEEDDVCNDLENGRYWNKNRMDVEIVPQHECTFLAGILRGWFAYSRLPSTRRTMSGSSRHSWGGFFYSFTDLIWLLGSKPYSQRETWERISDE